MPRPRPVSFVAALAFLALAASAPGCCPDPPAPTPASCDCLRLSIEVVDLPPGARTWSPTLIIYPSGATGGTRILPRTPAARDAGGSSDVATFEFPRPLDMRLDGKWQIKIEARGDVPDSPCMKVEAEKYTEALDVLQDELPTNWQVSMAGARVTQDRASNVTLSFGANGTARAWLYDLSDPAKAPTNLYLDPKATPRIPVVCLHKLQLKIRPDAPFAFVNVTAEPTKEVVCNVTPDQPACVTIPTRDVSYTVNFQGKPGPYDGRWYVDALPSRPLNAVASVPGGDIIAVGDGGLIMTFDGLTWRQQTQTTENWNGVTTWVEGAVQHAVAVGTMQKTLHLTWQGGIATPDKTSSGTAETLYAVARRAPDGQTAELMMVGDGSYLTLVSPYDKATSAVFAGASLRGVWPQPDNRGFFVAGSSGAKGALWSIGSGSIKEIQTNATPPPFEGLWGDGKGSLWMSGDIGAVWLYAQPASVTVRRPIPGAEGNQSLAVFGTGNQVWAVGRGGFFAEADTSVEGWQFKAARLSSVASELRGVWGDGDLLYAVGTAMQGGGIILRRN